MKKRVFIFAIVLCLFFLTGCASKDINSMPSNQLNDLKEDTIDLKIKELQDIIKDKDIQISNLQKDIESLNSKKEGIRNMIPQYINETNTIIDTVSKQLPILVYSNNDKENIEVALNWLNTYKGKSDGSINGLLDNEVVLKLGPSRPFDDNGKYCVDIIVYEVQSQEDALKDEWPRPIGKEFISHMMIIMEKQNNNWKVIDFIKHF